MRLVHPSRYLLLRLVAAAIALAAGAAWVGSGEARDQHANARGGRPHRARPSAAPRAVGAAMSASPHAAGVMVVVDPVTGGVVQATPDQLRELAAGSKTLGVGTSVARRPDPVIERWPDGTLVCTAPDWLTMFAVARRDAGGKLRFDCRHEPEAPAPTAAVPLPSESAPAPWEAK